jgi:hypothetical protein
VVGRSTAEDASARRRVGVLGHTDWLALIERSDSLFSVGCGGVVWCVAYTHARRNIDGVSGKCLAWNHRASGCAATAAQLCDKREARLLPPASPSLLTSFPGRVLIFALLDASEYSLPTSPTARHTAQPLAPLLSRSRARAAICWSRPRIRATGYTRGRRGGSWRAASPVHIFWTPRTRPT